MWGVRFSLVRAEAEWESAGTLFCLVPYTIGMGTSTEMRALLEQRAWHSTELGLHKEAAASLYAPHEQMGLLFSVFYYSDMWVIRCTLLDKTND